MDDDEATPEERPDVCAGKRHGGRASDLCRSYREKLADTAPDTTQRRSNGLAPGRMADDQVVWNALTSVMDGASCEKVAKDIRMHPKTVAGWIARAREQGVFSRGPDKRIVSLPVRGRQDFTGVSKLSVDAHEYMIDTFVNEPTLRQQDMQNQLKEQFGVDVSISTISRRMHQSGMRHMRAVLQDPKKMAGPQRVQESRDFQLRQIESLDMTRPEAERTLRMENVVAIDESNFTSETEKYGMGTSKHRPVIEAEKGKTAAVNVTLGIGLISVDPTRSSFTRDGAEASQVRACFRHFLALYRQDDGDAVVFRRAVARTAGPPATSSTTTTSFHQIWIGVASDEMRALRRDRVQYGKDAVEVPVDEVTLCLTDEEEGRIRSTTPSDGGWRGADPENELTQAQLEGWCALAEGATATRDDGVVDALRRTRAEVLAEERTALLNELNPPVGDAYHRGVNRYGANNWTQSNGDGHTMAFYLMAPPRTLGVAQRSTFLPQNPVTSFAVPTTERFLATHGDGGVWTHHVNNVKLGIRGSSDSNKFPLTYTLDVATSGALMACRTPECMFNGSGEQLPAVQRGQEAWSTSSTKAFEKRTATFVSDYGERFERDAYQLNKRHLGDAVNISYTLLDTNAKWGARAPKDDASGSKGEKGKKGTHLVKEIVECLRNTQIKGYCKGFLADINAFDAPPNDTATGSTCETVGLRECSEKVFEEHFHLKAVDQPSRFNCPMWGYADMLVSIDAIHAGEDHGRPFELSLGVWTTGTDGFEFVRSQKWSSAFGDKSRAVKRVETLPFMSWSLRHDSAPNVAPWTGSLVAPMNVLCVFRERKASKTEVMITDEKTMKAMLEYAFEHQEMTTACHPHQPDRSYAFPVVMTEKTRKMYFEGAEWKELDTIHDAYTALMDNKARNNPKLFIDHLEHGNLSIVEGFYHVYTKPDGRRYVLRHAYFAPSWKWGKESTFRLKPHVSDYGQRKPFSSSPSSGATRRPSTKWSHITRLDRIQISIADSDAPAITAYFPYMGPYLQLVQHKLWPICHDKNEKHSDEEFPDGARRIQRTNQVNCVNMFLAGGDTEDDIVLVDAIGRNEDNENNKNNENNENNENNQNKQPLFYTGLPIAVLVLAYFGLYRGSTALSDDKIKTWDTLLHKRNSTDEIGVLHLGVRVWSDGGYSARSMDAYARVDLLGVEEATSRASAQMASSSSPFEFSFASGTAENNTSDQERYKKLIRSCHACFVAGFKVPAYRICEYNEIELDTNDDRMLEMLDTLKLLATSPLALATARDSNGGVLYRRRLHGTANTYAGNKFYDTRSTVASFIHYCWNLARYIHHTYGPDVGRKIRFAWDNAPSHMFTNVDTVSTSRFHRTILEEFGKYTVFNCIFLPVRDPRLNPAEFCFSLMKRGLRRDNKRSIMTTDQVKEAVERQASAVTRAHLVQFFRMGCYPLTHLAMWGQGEEIVRGFVRNGNGVIETKTGKRHDLLPPTSFCAKKQAEFTATVADDSTTPVPSRDRLAGLLAALHSEEDSATTGADRAARFAALPAYGAGEKALTILHFYDFTAERRRDCDTCRHAASPRASGSPEQDASTSDVDVCQKCEDKLMHEAIIDADTDIPTAAVQARVHRFLTDAAMALDSVSDANASNEQRSARARARRELGYLTGEGTGEPSQMPLVMMNRLFPTQSRTDDHESLLKRDESIRLIGCAAHRGREGTVRNVANVATELVTRLLQSANKDVDAAIASVLSKMGCDASPEVASQLHELRGIITTTHDAVNALAFAAAQAGKHVVEVYGLKGGFERKDPTLLGTPTDDPDPESASRQRTPGTAPKDWSNVPLQHTARLRKLLTNEFPGYGVSVRDLLSTVQTGLRQAMPRVRGPTDMAALGAGLRDLLELAQVSAYVAEHASSKLADVRSRVRGKLSHLHRSSARGAAEDVSKLKAYTLSILTHETVASSVCNSDVPPGDRPVACFDPNGSLIKTADTGDTAWTILRQTDAALRDVHASRFYAFPKLTAASFRTTRTRKSNATEDRRFAGYPQRPFLRDVHQNFVFTLHGVHGVHGVDAVGRAGKAAAAPQRIEWEKLSWSDGADGATDFVDLTYYAIDNKHEKALPGMRLIELALDAEDKPSIGTSTSAGENTGASRSETRVSVTRTAKAARPVTGIKMTDFVGIVLSPAPSPSSLSGGAPRVPAFIFQNARGPRSDQIRKALDRKGVEDTDHQMRVLGVTMNKKEGLNANDTFTVHLSRWDTGSGGGNSVDIPYDGSAGNIKTVTKKYGRDTLIEIQSQVDYKSRTFANREDAHKKMADASKASDYLSKVLRSKAEETRLTYRTLVPTNVASLFGDDTRRQTEWCWDSFVLVPDTGKSARGTTAVASTPSLSYNYTTEWNGDLCLVLLGRQEGDRNDLKGSWSMRDFLVNVLKGVKHHVWDVRTERIEGAERGQVAHEHVFSYTVYKAATQKMPSLRDVKHVLRISTASGTSPSGVRFLATGDRLLPVYFRDRLVDAAGNPALTRALQRSRLELYPPLGEATHSYKLAWVESDRVRSAAREAPRWAQFAVRMLQGLNANVGTRADGSGPIEEALKTVAGDLYRTDEQPTEDGAWDGAWDRAWDAFKTPSSVYAVRRGVLSASIVFHEDGSASDARPVIFRDDPVASGASGASGASASSASSVLAFRVKKFNTEWVNKTTHVERPELTQKTPSDTSQDERGDPVRTSKKLLKSLLKPL